MELIPCGLGYEIELDFEIKERVGAILRGENVFIVTDGNIRKFYGEALNLDAYGDRLCLLRAGEGSKQLDVAGRVCKAMLAAGCNRSTTLVALGGGVVGDLAGFVAAIFMRGVRYVQIPTTLLAMVDSSVGGKTAVDLGFYKNMVGAFKQPDRVVVAVDFLATLKMRDFKSGLGEIIKTALLDRALFGKLQANATGLFASDSECLREVIADCIRYKVRVVEADERETGLRKVLNLGHTIGHGLEAAYRHKLSHGEYVLNGIWYELRLAQAANLVDDDYAHRVRVLVETALEGEILPVKRADEMMKYIVADKKNADGKICCILPVREGEVETVYYTHAAFRQLLERLQ